MNIEEEISKLLSTEAVIENKKKELPSIDFQDEGKIDLDPSSVQDDTGNTGEEDLSQGGLETLESAKVKEAALDDKLSIELRGIVKQIQVFWGGVLKKCVFSSISRTCKKKWLQCYRRERCKTDQNAYII